VSSRLHLFRPSLKEMPSSNPFRPGMVSRSVAAAEPHEIRSVMLSVLYFSLLFASFSVVKQVRDAMGA